MAVIPAATIETFDSITKRLQELRLEIEGIQVPEAADDVRDELDRAVDELADVIEDMNEAKSIAIEINDEEEMDGDEEGDADDEEGSDH